jgi:hypothetical protein
MARDLGRFLQQPALRERAALAEPDLPARVGPAEFSRAHRIGRSPPPETPASGAIREFERLFQQTARRLVSEFLH